jgi:5-methylcytosine-specific restriction enzyme subunit McrC
MIELPEHFTEIAETPTIPVEQQEQMASVLGNRLGIAWLSDKRVQIRSSSWVGSIHLTQELRVRVIPKLAGNSLGVLTMLAITDGSPLIDLPQYFRGLSDDPDEDATELLCRLVVSHTEKVLARGLIRNYRGHADDLPYLRGRLDAYRQATVYFGKFTEFACEYNEFDRDTIENHILLAGVRAARWTTTSASVRRRAADLERRLGDVAPTLPSRRKLLSPTAVVYGRRNAHYRVAHTWCRSLLRQGQVDDVDTPAGSEIQTFLINMNALFERFVDWLVARVYSGTGVDLQAQKRNPSLITVNGRHRRPIAPDLIISQSGRSVAIDAKYKKYDEWEISPSDVYQLLLYAQCYTGFTAIPTSYLIYPASRRKTPPTIVELTVPTDVGPRKVRVSALGIPLAEIVGGLRDGNQEPVQATIDRLHTELPIAGSELAAPL